MTSAAWLLAQACYDETLWAGTLFASRRREAEIALSDQSPL